MAGPYQPHQGTDPYPSQPLPYPETSGGLSPAPSYPGTSYPGTSYPGTSYPGTLPPPLPYPKRRRGRTIAAVLVSLAVVAGIVVAAVFAGGDNATNQPALLTPAASKERTWARKSAGVPMPGERWKALARFSVLA